MTSTAYAQTYYLPVQDKDVLVARIKQLEYQQSCLVDNLQAAKFQMEEYAKSTAKINEDCAQNIHCASERNKIPKTMCNTQTITENELPFCSSVLEGGWPTDDEINSYFSPLQSRISSTNSSHPPVIAQAVKRLQHIDMILNIDFGECFVYL